MLLYLNKNDPTKYAKCEKETLFSFLRMLYRENQNMG